MTWGCLIAAAGTTGANLAWVQPFDFTSRRVSTAASDIKRHHHLPPFISAAALEATPLQEPSESASKFGRKEYWNDFYRDNPSFSWYTGWEDLKPFLQELIRPEDHILIPGVGNDATLVDMYDDGYRHLTAFDYAPEGIECCKDLLGSDRIAKSDTDGEHDNLSDYGVHLFVGDARGLPNLRDGSFDAVLEKGTLDAILLSGGAGNEKNKKKHMEMAIAELSRVLKPGGLFISISAICTEALQASSNWKSDKWAVVRDGSLYVTDDGYASNNFDGDLMVWRKKSATL